MSSSEQTSLSEVTSANKVASDSVSQATSESEIAPQKSETATKGIKAACNDDQLIQMVARGEEAAMSLGATESQLLEWSELGESKGLTVQLKALSDLLPNNVNKHNNNRCRTKSGQALLRQQNKRNVH